MTMVNTCLVRSGLPLLQSFAGLKKPKAATRSIRLKTLGRAALRTRLDLLA